MHALSPAVLSATLNEDLEPRHTRVQKQATEHKLIDMRFEAYKLCHCRMLGYAVVYHVQSSVCWQIQKECLQLVQ